MIVGLLSSVQNVECIKMKWYTVSVSLMIDMHCLRVCLSPSIQTDTTANMHTIRALYVFCGLLCSISSVSHEITWDTLVQSCNWQIKVIGKSSGEPLRDANRVTTKRWNANLCAYHIGHAVNSFHDSHMLIQIILSNRILLTSVAKPVRVSLWQRWILSL